MTFEDLDLSMELSDVPIHLRNLHLCAIEVISVLPSQCLQFLVLDLVRGLSLCMAMIFDLLVLGLDLGVQRVAVAHEEDRGGVGELRLSLLVLLFITVVLGSQSCW